MTRPREPYAAPFAKMSTRALVVLTLINMFNYIDRYIVPPLFESLRRSGHGASERRAARWIDDRVPRRVHGHLAALRDAGRPDVAHAPDRLRRRAVEPRDGDRRTRRIVCRALHGTCGGRRRRGGLRHDFPGGAGRLLRARYARPHHGDLLLRDSDRLGVGLRAGRDGGLSFRMAGRLFRGRRTRAAAGAPGVHRAGPAARNVGRGEPSEAGSDTVEIRVRASLVRCARAQPHVRADVCRPRRLYVRAWRHCNVAAFVSRARPGRVPRERGVASWSHSVVTGFVGTFAGGWLGDKLLARNRQAYLWLSGIATLVATPIAFLLFMAPSPAVFWSATVVAEVLLFASTGPINATTVNIVSPTMRATAMAAQIFFIHLLGDVPSPPLIGAISDASSLGTAVLVVPVAVFVSGMFWIYAARTAGRADSLAP